MLFIIVELLQIDAVVDVVHLGAGDLLLPALLDDVVVSALHGEHHGIRLFIDPLFQPTQGDDGRVMRPGNAVGHDALRPEVGDLRHGFAAPLAAHPNTHGAGGRRHGGRHNGIRLRKLLVDAWQLPRKFADIVDALEAAALIVTALDVNIVDAVHRLLPPFSPISDEVDIRIMNGACGKDGHGMSHCHEILREIGLPRQGIILRRHRIVVDEPDVHSVFLPS